KSNVEMMQFATVANTSIESFQGLAGAAKTFGVTQEQLSDQLKDFNEKIGEFASVGSGGAMDFFEQIAVKTEGGAEGAKKLAVEM
ncbi:phage tail tape measure protein, partial [Acinetobacter baumannii]